MSRIFYDENNVYKVDFSKALWACDDINEKYKLIKGSILRDVDWVAELDEIVLMVEYKNCNIKDAVNPDAFRMKIRSDEHYTDIAKKFYDSLSYLVLNGKMEKGLEYVYILECDNDDSILRKKLRNKIQGKLPFELQGDQGERRLIKAFTVMTIDEWNNSISFSQYPITKI